ncbi:helix-turn-helix domain-containing protein [Izhakiella capsodis]|uniref:helix-turn-helix domain-containing protein n=1 Tax=Izhakiella capsodis TaxID=1367852 RepID=UPI001E476E76|nr:helix-turn-helix transcriptional regulator [Izhakiella capsodis]
MIYWASIGKTYAEISLILNISQRTVKFHMANVVSKMGVSNARHAIRQGIERGLITLPP